MVTGSGRGIGEGIAKVLAEHGASVVCAARRTEEIEKVASEIVATNGKAIAVTTDVTDEMAVSQLAEKTVKEFGRLDMWKMPYSKIPKYVQIETTILCDATCWFCPQKHATRQPNFMEDWVWKKIIDETRDMFVIYRPFILNEPFVDKRMVDVV